MSKILNDDINKKESSQSHTPPTDCELLVFSGIKTDGMNTTQLHEKNAGRFSSRTIDYAVKSLRDAGFIKRIGYGVWEAMVDKLPPIMYRESSQNTHRVAPPHTPLQIANNLPADSDRMHGVVVTIKIPKIRNWSNRADIMTKNKIPYRPIIQGQSLTFKDVKKVWLCNRSIVFYLPYSWFAGTSREALRAAVDTVLRLVKQLERYLHVSTFRNGPGYDIRFPRMHHALIKNALAKQYDRDKQKLHVYDERGLWMLIDNSWNLHETEFVRADSSTIEHAKFQRFFNTANEQEHPEHIFKLPEAIEGFHSKLRGFIQRDIANQNAFMSIGAALKQQTELLGRALERPAENRTGDVRALTEVISHAIDTGTIDIPALPKGLIAFAWDKEVEVIFIKDVPQCIVKQRGLLRKVGPFPKGARGFYMNYEIAKYFEQMGTVRMVIEE